MESSLGIAVMFIAVLMNIFVSSMLFKVAKETNSVSLYADGEHLRTDVYSSLGVLIGLVIIHYSGYYVLDPIIAIFVAIFIYRAGYNIVKRTWMDLLDHSLPEEDVQKIQNIINEYSGLAVLKENSLKARRVGPSNDIDIILQFPGETAICECHKICDEVENKIISLYPNCSISIHLEPICYRDNCQKECIK